MTLTVAKSSIAATYKRGALEFARGEGVWLWDAEGKKYLDLLAGIAVNALGHAHPVIMDAMQQGLTSPLHVSNLYRNAPAEALAHALCARSFASAVFFANSGTEAVEGAFKFAPAAEAQGGIVAFEGSFHGRSMGALSATWTQKYREPFEPLLPLVSFAPMNDVAAAMAAIDEQTSAVIIEPIQGEGGVVPASVELLQALRQRCTEVGTVLIFDEVQCGLGRTGTLWGHEPAQVEPDIMTLAKPLGGGLPIGAVLVNDWVAESISAGDHGSTFGGGPFVCRVAGAVLQTLSNPGFMAHVQAVGQVLEEGLRNLAVRHPDKVVAVRGRGLMWGVQLVESLPVDEFVGAGREAGLVMGTSGGNTLRLLPPLILEEEHVQYALPILDKLLGLP